MQGVDLPHRRGCWIHLRTTRSLLAAAKHNTCIRLIVVQMDARKMNRLSTNDQSRLSYVRTSDVNQNVIFCEIHTIVSHCVHSKYGLKRIYADSK